MTRGQPGDRRIAAGCVTETNFHAVVRDFVDGGVRDTFGAQVATQRVSILLLQFAECGVHVHFHQEVHTTTQLKTQLQRACAN